MNSHITLCMKIFNAIKSIFDSYHLKIPRSNSNPLLVFNPHIIEMDVRLFKVIGSETLPNIRAKKKIGRVRVRVIVVLLFLVFL